MRANLVSRKFVSMKRWTRTEHPGFAEGSIYPQIQSPHGELCGGARRPSPRTSPVHSGNEAMSLLRRLFGGKGDNAGHEPPSMPWDRRPSILEFVRSHIVAGKPGMAEGGYTLPDEERIGQG